MAGKITTNSVVLGDSVTDTQNFVLKTNADGTATLARGALGALGTVFGVNGSGALTGATLVSPTITGLTAAALPAGSVLQVVQGTYATPTSTTSQSGVSTGLAASITPKFSTSKIIVIAMQTGLLNTGSVYSAMNLFLVRNSTVLNTALSLGYSGNTLSTFQPGPVTLSYLDSPATTSSITYTTQFCQQPGGAGTVTVQNASQISTITLMEIAV